MLGAAPLFSVVIPVHNRAALVSRALCSVLAQTLQDFELIVVDDGSTDGTAEAITRHQDPRIHYRRQDHSGVCAARNHGAEHARGRFITFLDSDDEAMPEWLGTFAEMMKGADTGIACCTAVAVEPGAADIPCPIQNLGPAFANEQGLFLAGTFATTRELFIGSGGYAVGLRGCENAELMFRLIPVILTRGLAIRSTEACLVRLHYDSGRRRRGDERMLEGAAYCLERHAPTLSADPGLYSTYFAVAGVTAAKLSRYVLARHYLRQAVRVRPSELRHWLRLGVACVPFVRTRVWSSNP